MKLKLKHYSALFILYTLLVAIFAGWLPNKIKVKASPSQEQLTDVEFLRLENSAYKRQLLQVEADQLVDSICKSHKFDKCEIDFQKKIVTKKDK